MYLCSRNSEERHKRFDSLAQQVEHNTFNVGVLGSSPKRITKRSFLQAPLFHRTSSPSILDISNLFSQNFFNFLCHLKKVN